MVVEIHGVVIPDVLLLLLFAMRERAYRSDGEGGLQGVAPAPGYGGRCLVEVERHMEQGEGCIWARHWSGSALE